MVQFNGSGYFYVYNLQGDVAALIDADDTQMVEYGYDAWGNPISKTGSLAATIGTLNPFRYRGYVYDEETELYYLRSRYYNPVWKRFVNSNQHLGMVRGINTHNTYSYCFNSPCTMSDQSGQFALTAGLAAAQSVVPEIGAFLIILKSNLLHECWLCPWALLKHRKCMELMILVMIMMPTTNITFGMAIRFCNRRLI